MADVDGERGQLMLVAALALAVLFLSLPVILNTVIYTENLATRTADAQGSEIVAYRSAAEAGVGGVVDHANHHDNASYADLNESVRHGVANWSDLAGRQHAIEGRVVAVSLESTTVGTRLVQDTEGDFTNVSGQSDWTLAQGVTGTTAFRMNVTRSDLDGTDPFTIVVNNGSHTWSMTVEPGADSDEISVTVDPPFGAGGSCERTGTSLEIDVTAGQVGGTPCEPLAFAENLTGSYSISYSNAMNAVGTYELVVDKEISNVDGSSYYDEGVDSPYRTRAIYTATVEFEYESQNAHYRTNVTVAPEEP